MAVYNLSLSDARAKVAVRGTTLHSDMDRVLPTATFAWLAGVPDLLSYSSGPRGSRDLTLQHRW